MIPSANTVAREKPPPANRSYRLKRVPCPALRRKSASACTFTPGVAMCAPARYTTKQMKVTENFSQRSSGSLNTFSQEGSRNDMGDSGLDGTTRLLDLGARGRGNGHALHDELPAHVPHAQQLDGMVGAADQSGAEQRLRGDLDPLGELGQISNVHHLRRRHRDEVAHTIEHPSQRRMVRLDHRVLVVLQTERLERAPLDGGTADPGAPLEDAELALARRGQDGVAPRFPLAVLPRGRVP